MSEVVEIIKVVSITILAQVAKCSCAFVLSFKERD